MAVYENIFWYYYNGFIVRVNLVIKCEEALLSKNFYYYSPTIVASSTF